MDLVGADADLGPEPELTAVTAIPAVMFRAAFTASGGRESGLILVASTVLPNVTGDW